MLPHHLSRYFENSSYMSCSPTCTSLESKLSPDIKSLSCDPSQTSQLGDIGYVNEGGRWCRVLNIVDGLTCQKHGIKALQRTHDLKEYITERQREPMGEPFVKVFPGDGYQILAPDQMARYVYIFFADLI